MATAVQVQRGVAMFIDRELQPKATGLDKWIIAGTTVLYAPKIAATIERLADENNNIDVDKLVEAVRPAARQSPAKISIPMGGEITLTEADLDKLKAYINQA